MNRVWKPNVTVAALIERDGRFLLVEEETEDGLRFNQPAGHLDEGESLVADRPAVAVAALIRPRSSKSCAPWAVPAVAVVEVEVEVEVGSAAAVLRPSTPATTSSP